MAREAVEEPGRSWSLRREWSRAFLVLLVLLAALAGATIFGVRSVVGNVEGTARRLQHETTTVEVLSTQIVAHEEVGHKLLSDERVDRPSYLRQQQAITQAFVEAESDFPTAHRLRATIVAADLSWRRGLIEYGLWGAELSRLHGNHAAENPLYGASSDHTVALLAGLGSASLDEMHQELDHGRGLELLLTVALGGSFVLALGVLMFYRRRMTRHLVRPIAALHEGVMGLQAGDFDHRIEIARRDELGEVTAAFNEMIGAVQASHLALTVRATHDPLTGLANRAMLTERLAHSAGAGSDRRARQESLLFIDIDDFKDANDTLGHEGGDALLVEVAARLVACVRPHDLVTRLGGDEFAIVVAEDEDGTVAIEISERIMGALRDPFDIAGASVAVRVSIGIAQRGADSGDAAELLRSADFAMYSAKRAGKGRFEVFDARMHDDMIAGSVPRWDLSEAITSGELRLDYAPVVELSSGRILGVEALVRWQHPAIDVAPQVDDVTVARETRDIRALGHWALETAVRQLAGWRQTMPGCADLWVSVNLSRSQSTSPEFLALVQRCLEDPSVRDGGLVLEVAETALVADAGAAIAGLRALRRAGARIAIDGFGTGVLSLSSLATLPVDILRIDRSSVPGGGTDFTPEAVLARILGLASVITSELIVEGIETADELELLRKLDCRAGQGAFLAGPLTASELEALLQAGGIAPLV